MRSQALVGESFFFSDTLTHTCNAVGGAIANAKVQLNTHKMEYYACRIRTSMFLFWWHAFYMHWLYGLAPTALGSATAKCGQFALESLTL